MTAADHSVNRVGWPSGPWDREPDKLQFVTRAGYAGLVVRNGLGALCGYVGVPEGHPAFQRSWESSDSYERGDDGELDYDRAKPNPVSDLRVHGGVTFAEFCQEGGPVCHVPDPGMPDRVWWIGFDCSHAGDESPGMLRYTRHRFEMYRDVDYVRAQVESLGEQLKALAVSP